MSSKLVFRSSDFDGMITATLKNSLDNIVQRSQEIHDAWLTQGKVVYLRSLQGKDYCEAFMVWNNKEEQSKYSAHIVCVEEIQRCEHPAEKVTQKHKGILAGNPKIQTFEDAVTKSALIIKDTLIYQCECGQKVEPNSYRSVE